MNIEQVIDKAIELAEARPDHIYQQPPGTQTCSYVPQPEAPEGCIFGQALMALGVPEATLRRFEAQASPAGVGITVLLDRLRISYPDHVRYSLREAQNQQDTGQEWGAGVLRHLKRAKQAL